ncbi:hypothetical protein B0H14DRAFT_3087245 [Mycena olivaceomarginata]|nr:hypothetical protein B0H14DRAFT_3095155 [Mycena olivaceomarginata]KAJ7837598.1 hypothetical protein B0H14DRAFT_3087245 [Mycena olivaceomarginata]
MSFAEAHYHPFLFTMMILVGLAEAGLTAPRYHSLLLFILFNACWTMLFAVAYMLWLVDGAKHLLANIASSIFWLTVTATLWGVSAGVFHYTRTGGNCPTSPTISRCRQSLTVEALAWAEFAFGGRAVLDLRVRDSVRDSRRMV